MTNIINKIKSELPEDAMIADIAYEGSEIILYTKNREFFKNNTGLIKKIVNKIKKRIEVRAHPDIVKDKKFAKETILNFVPDSADIRDIYFEPEFAKVVIHASKPGLVIGKNGMTLNVIKNKTLWTPEIKRAPIIDSDVIKTIRKMLHKEAGYRKKFLNDLGKKIYSEREDVDWIRVTALGGFRQVGRSCILLQTPQSNLLLDCGISVKKESNPYPYLDAAEFDIQDLDGLVITHAHMDHSGLAPYLYKYGYRGPMYCTAPTRDTMTMLQLDYLKICKMEGGDAPYDSKDIQKGLKHCIVLDYNEVSDITPDMRLTLGNAGHLLGSACAHIHIGEGFHNLLYTGDLKYANTRLFEPAYTDYTRVESLIIESTYGNKKSPSHEGAEKKLIKTVKKTINNEGKVLIPVFAVGRSQEVITILMDSDIEVPVYLDGMVWDATAIHTAYPEFMSKNIQKKILHRGNNPFLDDRLKGIGSQKERQQVLDKAKPCVVLSTSGMLVGGPVFKYLERFAKNDKNMLIFVGYQAEGTIGRRIQKGWKRVPLENKSKGLELNLQIKTVDGLGGHSDQNQLINFVKHLKTMPQRMIVDHGETKSAIGLAKKLHRVFRRKTQAPKNLETIRLR